jgi:lysozyme family protein
VTPFDRAISFVLSHEGGYVNHPNDPGGETKYGISKRSYPNEDIKKLTVDRAKELYHDDYWLHIRGPDLIEPLATPLLDYAVNSGVKRAIRGLQATLRLKRDGEFGPLTLEAVQVRVEARGALKLAEEVILGRALFLTRIGCQRRGSEVFLAGWMRRIRDNLRHARSHKET